MPLPWVAGCLGAAALLSTASSALARGSARGAGALFGAPGRGGYAGGARGVLRRWLAWAAIGLCIGALSGAWGACWRAEAMQRFTASPASCYEFHITGDATASSFGVQHEALVIGADGAFVARVRLSLDGQQPAGTRLRLIGRVSLLERGAWGRSRYMAGEVAEVHGVSIQSREEGTPDPIDAFRSRMLAVIEPSECSARALIAGIVCGRTTELSGDAASDAFARTGTSHLVAVSGSHLALLAALARGVLARCGAGTRLRAAVLVVLMGAYVVFTGSSPSAVRSFFMVVLALLSSLGGRRGHGVSALALTVVALVALDAGTVYDLGFQLSAASVFFIQVFSRYLACLLERMGFARALAEALSLTACAQWATLPLTVPVFGECSLIAPLANVMLGPIMSALLVTGLVTVPAASVLPSASGALLALPEALASVSVFAAEVLADVPYASMAVEGGPALWLLYGAAALVYLVWWDARRAQFAVACAVLPVALACHAVRWSAFAPAAVTVLDVGQADAILVRDGSAAVLVDAGVDDAVAAALARNNVFRLDAVVITHWDRDHCGGLEAVLASVPVGRIVIADGALAGMPDEIASLALPDVVEIACGDDLAVGGFTCTMVWPRESVSGEENADSIALSVRYHGGGRSLSLLLTGDTEADEGECYAAEAGDVDVLKLGHHGSAESVNEELLDALRPEVAIASAGSGNPYGHPARACVEAVDDAGARFICTIDAGDVTIEPGADGVLVGTSRLDDAG